jgi:hypothetical protein
VSVPTLKADLSPAAISLSLRAVLPKKSLRVSSSQALKNKRLLNANKLNNFFMIKIFTKLKIERELLGFYFFILTKI